MSPFEYALGLISILMSIALADVVMSLHKLLRHRHAVKWDGRALIAAALVILEVIRIWFAQWTLRDVNVALGFPVYLLLFAHILLLVLTAAACLPDDIGDDCDLSAFYERNRRYFWGAFVATQATYFAAWFIFGGNQSSVGGSVGAMDWFRMIAPLAAYSMLAILRVRTLDYVVPISLLAFYGFRYWPQTLVG